MIVICAQAERLTNSRKAEENSRQASQMAALGCMTETQGKVLARCSNYCPAKEDVKVDREDLLWNFSREMRQRCSSIVT